jgi:hypothetical protein
MAVHALLPKAEDEVLYEATPWVLLVGRDWFGREKVRRTLEEAGCAIELASTADEALFCLAVMTPALVVIEDVGALPGAGDFLDRARLIGVNTTSDRDVVREQLAKYRQRDRSQLFGEARDVEEMKDLRALGLEPRPD